MRARGFGRIIQISSNAAHSIGPLLGVYSATKLALEAFSEAARAEVQGFGIDVVVIAMGAVTTNIAQNRTVIDHRGTPYEELVESRLVEMASMRVQPSSAEAVAEVVWEAATTPDPPFRMYVDAGPGAAR
jgi:short-subunit dehydrogenase